MGIFDRLFGIKKAQEQPDISFGRYANYKSTIQIDQWILAEDTYALEQYETAIIHFLNYLNTPNQSTVYYEKDSKGISFHFFHGSKRINGTVQNGQLNVRARIVRCSALQVGFLRQLLDKNFHLKYGRYALDESDDIIIRYDAPLHICTPHKLYRALKEVAVHADKLDDLLLDSFDTLHPVNDQHIVDLKPLEKAHKYTFFQQEINRVLDFVQQPNFDSERFSGGIAYCLLALAYQLDYLLVPKGYILENIEQIHLLFFSTKTNESLKNQQIISIFQQIQNRSKTAFDKEIYQVQSTFGIAPRVSQEVISNFIAAEIGHFDWYFQHEHPVIAAAILDFIVGYCLFQYTVPQTTRALMHLYFEIRQYDFFAQLGFEQAYYYKNGQLNRSAIRSEIKSIIKSHLPIFPDLRVPYQELTYSSPLAFAHSFLKMLQNSHCNAAIAGHA